MLTDAQPLSERFRPRTWGEVVGQDKAIRLIQRLAALHGGFGGQAYFISGGTGTGKTSIGRLIAAEVASEWATIEADASAFDMDTLREIETDCHYYGLGKGGRAYIVNECHGLRAAQVRRLLTMWEPIPSHVCWVLTTTAEGEAKLFDDLDDSSPLIGRCNVIRLARRGPCQPFARHLKACLIEAGMDGHKPDEWYERVVKDCRNSLRASFDTAIRRLDGGMDDDA